MYNLLCRLTGQLWEGEALKAVNIKPMGTRIGSFTGCINVLASHLGGYSLRNVYSVSEIYAHDLSPLVRLREILC